MGRDNKYCNKKTIKIKEKKSIRTIRMLDCL